MSFISGHVTVIKMQPRSRPSSHIGYISVSISNSYYNDITREPWCLKSPTTQLFVQQLALTNTNNNSKNILKLCITGLCLITASWCCRKNSRQWQRSFQWKLHSHWRKFLRQCHVAVERQGPGPTGGKPLVTDWFLSQRQVMRTAFSCHDAILTLKHR